MAAIDRFVEVFISKSTQQIDITSFSIPLILSEHEAFPERARVYNSLEGVAEDFDTTSPTYIMATQLFGQQLVFPEIVVGRKDIGETYPEALFEVQEQNDNWYALVMDSHDEDEVMAMAATIQGMTKIFLTSTDDASVRSPVVDDDLGSYLRDTNYDRTALIWSASADTQYPEAAWLYQLLEVPGSNTWAMKQLNGVTVDRLSETDVNTFEDKHVNYFRTVKGASIIMTGTMADGTWIDYSLVA